jgi:hypothetical protein
LLDAGAVDVGAFVDDAVAYCTVVEARTRQEARMRIHRPPRVVEGERRVGAGEHDVGVVKRANRSDVGPVAAKDVRMHAIAAEGVGDDLLAEIGRAVLRDAVEQHVPREHVDPHRGHERLVGRQRGQTRGLTPFGHFTEPFARRLLLERRDLPVAIQAKNAHAGRVFDRHRLRGNGDVGAAIDVRVDQIEIVHPVEMIAGEDEVVVRVVSLEMARSLTDGVGGALIPVRIVRRLFGRQDFDEPAAEEVHAVRLRDVSIQRRRVELCEHEDAPDVGMEAIADRDVDQTVLAADRDRRFRTVLG